MTVASAPSVPPRSPVAPVASSASDPSPDPRRIGRIVGLLWLAHGIGAFVLNAVVLGPVFAAPGFLENAAAEPWRLPTAMLMNLALALTMLALTIVARPVFKRHAPKLALAHLLIVAVLIALSAGENVGLFVMQRVSEAHKTSVAAAAAAATSDASAQVAAGPDLPPPGGFAGPRLVAAAVRNGAHFTNVFLAGFSILLFYIILFKGRLIPRPLAAMVALAAISQMIGVGRPFFGGATDFRYLMPIAVLHLAGTIWLIVRGFAPSKDGA